MRKPLTRMRSLGAVLAMLIGSSVLVGAVAATTATTAGATGWGLLKVCKTWTPTTAVAGLTVDNNAAPFVFYVSNGESMTTLYSQAGSCSNTISVETGVPYTVTEQVESWYQETAIGPGQGTPASDLSFDSTALPGYTPVTVTIPADGDEAAVDITDSLVTGQAKLCKADSAAGDNLSGTFDFALTNTADEESGSGGLTFDVPDSVTIPVGGSECSAPVTVPAGVLEVTELGTNLYDTGVTATLGGPPGPNELVTMDDIAGTSESDVLPQTPSNYFSPDSPSLVTVISYTDATVGLEICKFWDGDASTQPQGAATTYSFTETVISGVAGPDTAPTTIAPILAGGCTNPSAYRAGTTVEITESAQPGTEVYNIVDSGSLTTVGSTLTPPPYPNVATRTTEVIVGASTGQGLTPEASESTNSAEVDFYDGLAYPSSLEICKNAPADTGPYTFTVAGPQYVSEYTGTSGTTVTPGWFYGEIAPGSFTVSVLAGGCEPATPMINPNDPSSEFLLPYDSTQLVTESATTGYSASAITASLTDVLVWEGSPPVDTDTGTPVLANTMLGSSGTTSSVDVTMSEGPSDTLLYWTNVDPPAPSTSITPVTVANPGGSNAGTTTAPTLPEAISVSKVVSNEITNPHVRPELTRYEHKYLQLNKQIKAAEKALRSSKLTKAQRIALLHRLARLRAERSRYALDIVRLTL